MKKFICTIVCILMAFSLCLVGCDKGGDSTGDNGSNEKVFEKVYAFELGDIRLEEGMLLSKQQDNEAYLKSLDVDKLLCFFYQVAGLPVRNNAQPYSGWEAHNVGWSVAGHTLGHYLSAISMLYAETDDVWYKNTVDDIVAELKKCQQANGYVFSKPEADFDPVLQGRNDNGVIFYTMHKILAGLFDAYRCVGNNDALTIASDLINWVYSKISPLNTDQIAAMLRVEYGGMNEVCYQIYEVTKNEKHLKVAQTFDELIYVNAWANGTDNIGSLHANTQVPKAVGFAKGYMVTGDEELLEAAEFFWDIVATKRTFATGGHAENEHFGPAGVTSDQLYYNPDETCNIYNMCKLSAYLYEITGDNKYVDFLERALLNGIAGSINEDGGKTYYQWLSPDAQKLFHTADSAFWCCTGTGMESFSKLASTLGFKTDKGVKINIFQSSSYDYNGIKFIVENNDDKNKITFTAGGQMELQLRVPYYAKGFLVIYNGTTLSAKAEDGYIKIDKAFNTGDVIDYQIVNDYYIESTHDKEDVFAIKYGPYMLAGVGSRYEKRNYIKATKTELEEIDNMFSTTDTGFVFTVAGERIPMMRYCDIVDETYTAYYERVDEMPAEAAVENFAMRARLSSDLGYATKHSNTLGHNVWYDYSGSCTYLEAMNDGYVGLDSLGTSPYSNALFKFFVPYTVIPAGQHWVGFEFAEVKQVSSLSVYFYDNYAQVKAPSSYTVQYYNGTEWVEVANMSEATTKRDKYNTVTFDAVNTTAVRLVVNGGKQMGIIEIKIN